MRREYAKDGKLGVMFITTYAADGGLYEHTVFSKSLDDDKMTDRGEPITFLNVGDRVLIRRNPPMRDKASGRTMVDRLSGKVLNVQKP